MSRDLAARLRALAERHPVAADAAELRELATAWDRERRTGGEASAAARAAAMQPARAAALTLATSARSADPLVTQAALADQISSVLGSSVPAPDALRRWLRAWERSGELPSISGKQRMRVRTGRTGACHTVREQEPPCPAPPSPRRSRPSR